MQGSEPSVLRITMWYVTSVGLLESPFAMPVEMGEIRGIESVTEIVRQSTKKATPEAFAEKKPDARERASGPIKR